MKKQTLNFLFCPKCKQNLISIEKEVAGDEVIDGLLQCINCESSFGFVLKDLGESEYFWDIWNNTTVGLYLSRWEKHHIDQAFQKNKCIRSVLDVGCGSGRFSIPLYKKGFNIVALEFDKTPLLKLKSKEETIPIILGNGKKLPFKNQSFDCITCIQALDYIDIEHFSFFKECNRVLKDKGLFLFTSHNMHSYKRAIRRLTPWGKYRALPYPKLNDLKQKLHTCGFMMEKIKGYDWIPLTRWNNTKFAYFFAFFERLLKLEALTLISPRLFFTARKVGNKK